MFYLVCSIILCIPVYSYYLLCLFCRLEHYNIYMCCFGFQFRYATGYDKLFMAFGSVCGVAHGACLPVFLLVFGDMTDLFIDADNNNNPLNETQLIAAGCNWTQFDFTWEDIAPPGGNFHDIKYEIAKMMTPPNSLRDPATFSHDNLYSLLSIFVVVVFGKRQLYWLRIQVELRLMF